MLNVSGEGELDGTAKNKIVQRPHFALLDDPPNMNELLSVIGSMQDGKAVGRDGIISDVWKHGGQKMAGCLFKLIQNV